MSEIIPAILPKSFEELSEKLSSVRGLVETVQIDICDGAFVPTRTWPYQKAGELDKNFKEIVTEKTGLPYWEDVNFEIDLMVREPEAVIPGWIKAGASRIIFHIESTTDAQGIHDQFHDKVEIGVAIGLDTSLTVIQPYAPEVGVIQCMGIARIGYQGQPFDDRVLPRISELRTLYPKAIISVDGGVNLESARKLLLAGANRLVVGSALWKDAEVRENLSKFKKLNK